MSLAKKHGIGREFVVRAFDTRINTMYPYVRRGWNGAIEARLDKDDANTIEDITMEHANGNFNDYDGEIITMYDIRKRDKHGKKIYEGDIIQHQNKEADRTPFVVPGMTPENMSDIADLGDGEWEIEENKYSNIEIIGNIFENPELLK